MPCIQQRHERARVLVLDTAPGVWGAQNYLLRMVGPLAERGVDLILAAPAGLELAEHWRARSLLSHEIALSLERSVRRGDGNDARVSARAAAREAAALVRNVGVIRRAAREVGADLIWANGHAMHLDGALAGRLAGIPVVLHLHEELPQTFGRLVRAAAVALSTRSVAVSEAIATALPRPLARRVKVIGNGVDVELFGPAVPDPEVRASLGATPADTLVVALTRLDPKKRIEDLIEAAADLLDEPRWRLAFVGTTSAFPDYATRVRALGEQRLGDRVTFAGRREDVVDVLNAADVVAHAGVVEGTPLCLLEAQACGKPVVAYRTSGVSESVVDGVTGLLAPPRDVPGLAGRLRTLVGDPEQRATMGRAARAHAVARDGIEAQIERNAALLSGVLRRQLRAPTN